MATVDKIVEGWKSDGKTLEEMYIFAHLILGAVIEEDTGASAKDFGMPLKWNNDNFVKKIKLNRKLGHTLTHPESFLKNRERIKCSELPMPNIKRTGLHLIACAIEEETGISAHNFLSKLTNYINKFKIL